MAHANLPVSHELHQIECHGEHSYWVTRYSDSGDDSGRPFSRVVFFAHSKREAEAYIRQQRQPH